MQKDIFSFWSTLHEFIDDTFQRSKKYWASQVSLSAASRVTFLQSIFFYMIDPGLIIKWALHSIARGHLCDLHRISIHRAITPIFHLQQRVHSSSHWILFWPGAFECTQQALRTISQASARRRWHVIISCLPARDLSMLQARVCNLRFTISPKQTMTWRTQPIHLSMHLHGAGRALTSASARAAHPLSRPPRVLENIPIWYYFLNFKL